MENKKIVFGGLFFVVVIILIIAIFVIKKDNKKSITVEQPLKKENIGNFIPYDVPENASKITGLACENNNKRAFAVMYSGDQSARKYFSNLSLADFVLEMPHRSMHGQPRLMGVFQCNTPEIVGPMRSGRTDHISVAGALDAIYVPWGGSSVGKALLEKHVINHIDCNGEVTPGGGSACFRRSGPMSTLESASSSIPELIKVAEKVGYRKESQTKGFEHQGDLPLEKRPDYSRIRVKFEKPSDVEYLYDKPTNSYLRFFGGKEDIDYETKKQYAPKNLITIITKKDTWQTDIDYVGQGLQDPWDGIDPKHRENDNGQYPNMQLGDPWFDTKFEGPAEFFFNGQHIEGTWKREKGLENPFKFFDEKGIEIHFVPGQIWMHVLEHSRTVSYEDEKEYQERIKNETENISATPSNSEEL